MKGPCRCPRPVPTSAQAFRASSEPAAAPEVGDGERGAEEPGSAAPAGGTAGTAPGQGGVRTRLRLLPALTQ